MTILESGLLFWATLYVFDVHFYLFFGFSVTIFIVHLNLFYPFRDFKQTNCSSHKKSW